MNFAKEINIKKEIKTNVIFNQLKKKKFELQQFNSKNIEIIDANTYFMRHNAYYMRFLRGGIRIEKGLKFLYISPTDSDNKLESKFPVNIGSSYKLIFFSSAWDIKNIETFNIVNGSEIISLKSQVNDNFSNYTECNFKSNVENISLIISFKNKQKKSYANGLYLLNKYLIYNKDDVLYKNILKKKENEFKSYLDENKKIYDIVICIAIWNRHEVLKKVVNLINSYDLPFSVGFALIYSKDSDYNLFPENKNVHFIFSPNKTLGSKWLTGVYSSQLFDPKMIMILGSDDMISKAYIKEAYDSIAKNNYDFSYATS